MNRQYKIALALTIIFVVSFMTYYFNEPLTLLLYNSILALFPQEIKEFFSQIPNIKKIRLSYSYIFRIQIDGNYLLVKDEQGRNNYHPVGGAYKYDSDNIDLGECFEGIYDNLFNTSTDTRNDLRIIIKSDKLNHFKKWFSSQANRENINDLNREFTEELIESGILPMSTFNVIKYKYIGSYTQKSYNEKLHMKQIRHFDILSIKLTKSQKAFLNQMMNKASEKYLFANEKNIQDGYVHFAGKRYDIAAYSNLILIGKTDSLSEEFDKKIEHTVRTNIKGVEK